MLGRSNDILEGKKKIKYCQKKFLKKIQKNNRFKASFSKINLFFTLKLLIFLKRLF